MAKIKGLNFWCAGLQLILVTIMYMLTEDIGISLIVALLGSIDYVLYNIYEEL